MSNDKTTLADVQPGGRVRLGDADPMRSALEDALQFVETLHSTVSGDSRKIVWRCLERGRAALSAQPSPGGQQSAWILPDDARIVGVIADNIERGKLDHPGFYRNTQLGEVLRRVLSAALAARQPVGEPAYNSAGISLTACQLHEALLMAGDPELDVPLEDRSLVRIFWTDTGHSGPGLYCECVGAEEEGCILLDGTAPAIGQPEQGVDLGQAFQAGVAEWMGQCFLPSLYSNMTERGDRLLEEVLELLQAHGYDKARVPTLVDYVFGRPVGDPAQEVGGVMVTLAGYCWVAGMDMHAAGDAELARINHPEVMAKIRAKHEAKNALHFDTPLPGNAAAPIPAQAVDLDAMRALLQRRIEQWRSHLPADPGAPGTREIETNGEHDYNNDVRIYREGIAVMEEVLSKIDSQAVGK